MKQPPKFGIISLQTKNQKGGHFTLINYTKLGYQLKRKITNYSKKISKSISKPKTKFVSQMIYGLLKGQSVLLSNIARSLKEDITLKKTIDRLSRNLKNFDKKEKVMENYINNISPFIDDDTVFCCDKSDIVKPYSKKLEAIDYIRDGSTGKRNKGYDTFEIIALTDKKQLPVGIYSKIYSRLEKGFKSRNIEAFKGLDFTEKHFGKKGVYALDRGYDANKFYKYFIKGKKDFVIRSKKNRSVIYKGESLNILKVANLYKGKYVNYYKDKHGKNRKVKFSYAPIKLPALPQKELTLVIIHGYGKLPILLITNIKPQAKKLTLAIVKVYLKRWKIEEYFRFKKQQFNFENIRVRSLHSIRIMDLLLTIAIGMIAKFSAQKTKTKLMYITIKISKRIYDIPEFNYYALADGFSCILEKTVTGIKRFLRSYYQKRQSQGIKLMSLPL